MAQPISSPSGIDRFADRITPAVLSDAFPLDKVREAVAVSGRTSQRHRALPAHIVVYYDSSLFHVGRGPEGLLVPATIH